MIGWIREHAPAASTTQLTRAAIAVSVLIVGLAAATLFLTIQNRASLDATRRFEQAQSLSDDVSACRAALTIELLTGPTARALKVASEHGLDSPEYQAAVRPLDPDRAERLAALSRTNPQLFLKVCRTEAPG